MYDFCKFEIPNKLKIETSDKKRREKYEFQYTYIK